MYHIVCPAKYRRVVFSEAVDEEIKKICFEIAIRYEKDHVHFLVQSVPMYSPKKIVQIIKSITAREIFKRVPTVKKQLWGGEFWSDGYFVSTVGKHGNETKIQNYVKNQGRDIQEYKVLYRGQLSLFTDKF